MKELIISGIIIVLIIIGEIVTQNYTKSTIEIISNNLEEIKEEIKKDEVDEESLKAKINSMYDEWNKRHPKLSYYIEHDELENVEINFSGIDDYIEEKNYDDAVVEIDKTNYSLKHIRNKINFSLENIF